MPMSIRIGPPGAPYLDSLNTARVCTVRSPSKKHC